MKKSLIALAVLASTGAAMAQSSVTLYGIVDVNLQSAKSDGLRQTKVDSGGVSGSRFGLKGTEDLGGGLKALFVLENGFNADNGSNRTAGSIFDREAYVGFSGGFGEVRIGNSNTAYDDVSISTDPVFDSILSPANLIWAQSYNSRPGNTIYYTSPSFAGFTVTGSYSLGENKTATTSAKGVAAANVQYTGGPVFFSVAYQESQKADAAYNTALATYTATPTTANLAAVNAAASPSHKDTLVQGSYDFGVAKLLAAYNRNVAADDTKSNQYQIGVDVPVGAALVVSGGFAYSKDKLNGVDGDKRTAVGIGASYSLSKRTSIYTGLNYGESKDTAGVKTKADIYAVGIRHAF
ncbi:porin [Rhodoferax sp.]|uniref:porin n=1 Tax=Rhodoferax sp. TaxID=50421 RepID=UPI00374DD8C9